MKRKDRGFTLVEIVVVLFLITIITVAVFSHSITTDQINFVGQVDKIRQHIRYAQSLAMKGDAIWGVKCFAKQYWLFNPNTTNLVRLPGEKADKVSLTEMGVGMDSFTVYFDELGVPYKFYPYQKVTNSSTLTTEISNATETESRTLTITPETGLIIITQ